MDERKKKLNAIIMETCHDSITHRHQCKLKTSFCTVTKNIFYESDPSVSTQFLLRPLFVCVYDRLSSPFDCFQVIIFSTSTRTNRVNTLFLRRLAEIFKRFSNDLYDTLNFQWQHLPLQFNLYVLYTYLYDMSLCHVWILVNVQDSVEYSTN